MKKLRIAYYDQARAAKIRKIEFLLTFDEWLKEWEDSGHLAERGRRKGQYCMSRPGDKGPYAVGNVRIVVVGDNHREAHKGKPIKPEVLNARIGKKRSAAFCESARIRNMGRVVSAESRAKGLENPIQKKRVIRCPKLESYTMPISEQRVCTSNRDNTNRRVS